EIKVGQKYQIVGGWTNPENEVVTVLNVSKDVVYTKPAVYGGGGTDEKKLFFPDFRAYLDSGEKLGYVLEEEPEEEVRSVSSTGAEKGVKRARFSLLPMEALTEV